MSAAMHIARAGIAPTARRPHRLNSRRPHQLHRAVSNKRLTLRPAAVLTPPTPSPARTDAERRAEEALLAGDDSDGTIAGFTKLEWSCIQTPARYLGNEVGARHKDWDSARVRFTMAYPEIYEVGASNLGHVVLYTILNNQPGMLCDRAYLPGDDMLQLLRSKNRQLFAVESKRPLKHFDALGMSLAYELSAVNVLEMMHLSGLPLTWAARDDEPEEVWNVDDGSWPLVFVGGPTATSNPEPIADFVDFVALGDGEDVTVEIGRCLEKTKAEGLNREETLFRLATEVEGICEFYFYFRMGNVTDGVFFSRRPPILRLPERVGRRGVSHEGGGPGAVQKARRGPGSDAAGGFSAVRQHGARQADGGDSEGVHAGMPVLPTRHAHEAREGRPAGEGGGGGGEGDEGDGV